MHPSEFIVEMFTMPKTEASLSAAQNEKCDSVKEHSPTVPSGFCTVKVEVRTFNIQSTPYFHTLTVSSNNLQLSNAGQLICQLLLFNSFCSFVCFTLSVAAVSEG